MTTEEIESIELKAYRRGHADGFDVGQRSISWSIVVLGTLAAIALLLTV